MSGRDADAGPTGWFALVLQHHIQIEAAFAAVQGARSARSRRAAMRRLATMLTGHAIAKEAALYPAMADTNQQGGATAMHAEQRVVNLRMAALADLDPMSRGYLDKLEGLRIDVANLFGVEEGECFPKLRRTADRTMNGRLTHLYRAEFERYMGVAVEHRVAASG